MLVSGIGQKSIVRVDLGARSYDVRVAPGLLEEAGEHLRPLLRNGRAIVVSDEQVWAAQGSRFSAALDGLTVEPVLVAAGEASKSFPVLADLIDRLLSLGLERSDQLIAF